jgi:isoamylase
MIAFRERHPSLARSVFWRDDVKWYGLGESVDWSQESRSLAYCLHGASVNDNDLYVMINAHWQPQSFVIQEGKPGEWKQIVDTDLDSPDDFLDPAGASFCRFVVLYGPSPIRRRASAVRSNSIMRGSL